MSDTIYLLEKIGELEKDLEEAKTQIGLILLKLEEEGLIKREENDGKEEI